MEVVLIYTDTAHTDQGAVQSFEMDMAFGADEQDFEIAFSEPELSGGELLYIDGTEYGGIVDSVTHSTESDKVIYKGRTWHGMLAGKIVKPPAGANYYTVSGDANTCIAALLSHVGLTDVLTARTSTSGITVTGYSFERFTNAYNGLLKMLGSNGAVLRIERHDGITELWAEQRNVISNEADSDLMEFAITDSYRVPNHLVCAGEGELQGRVIVDLYADASGNVSQTQTLTGVDEIAVLYNYNNADTDELIIEGTKELESYQQGGGADLQVNSKGEWHIGDRLQVRDNRSGTVITSAIGKKIVKVKDGILSVDYEVGDATAQSYGGSSADELSGAAADNGGYQFFTEKGRFGTDYEADWFLVKIDKSRVCLGINQNNDSYTNAWEATSNAFDWLTHHPEYDMAHNCNYSGGETTAAVQTGHYAMRYEGVNYAGGVDEPQNRPRLAFNSTAQDFKWYAGGIDVTTIPANYDYVFACSDMLIDDGVVKTTFNEGGWDAQRVAFGWDDSFWYVFYAEGRNPLNRGLQLPYIASLLHDKFGVRNAVNLDGGGSVCCAANIPQPMKVNGYVLQTGARGSCRPTTFNMNYKGRS